MPPPAPWGTRVPDGVASVPAASDTEARDRVCEARDRVCEARDRDLWLGIGFAKLGIGIPWLGIEFAKLGIEIPWLGIEFAKLGIEFAKLGIEFAKLGIGFAKLGIEIPSLGIEFAKVGIDLSRPARPGERLLGPCGKDAADGPVDVPRLRSQASTRRCLDRDGSTGGRG